ncbi:hypothetical protein MKEN_01078100 [Mycena kentingensis (nom. inval.)]|nr:hypothetical protein MKEN_01078100 [Mycena kentingensis (nom. inval.)]
MSSFYSFSPKTTSISFSWPKELIGIERVALSAQGDLQRILSAFFARPIVLALIYSHTFKQRTDHTLESLSLPNPNAVAAANPEIPLVQNRQVHLQCAGKVVCVATSTVKISSARCAHLFLEEKFGIGQLFSKLNITPSFELLGVGIGGEGVSSSAIEKGFGRGEDVSPATVEKGQLWRKYRLATNEIECTILEVFTSREMFISGQAWLDEQPAAPTAAFAVHKKSNKNALLMSALLLVLVFELYMYSVGGRSCK